MHISQSEDGEGIKALQAQVCVHEAAVFAREVARRWGLTVTGPAADGGGSGGGGGGGGEWRVPVVLGGDYNSTPGPKFDPTELSKQVGRGGRPRWTGDQYVKRRCGLRRQLLWRTQAHLATSFPPLPPPPQEPGPEPPPPSVTYLLLTTGRLDPDHLEHPSNWRAWRRQRRAQQQPIISPKPEQPACCPEGGGVKRELAPASQAAAGPCSPSGPPQPHPPPPAASPAQRQWAAPIALPLGPLQSGVAAAAGGDPALTFHAPRLSATIDHIFATPRLLRAVGWMAMPWDALRALDARLQQQREQRGGDGGGGGSSGGGADLRLPWHAGNGGGDWGPVAGDGGARGAPGGEEGAASGGGWLAAAAALSPEAWRDALAAVGGCLTAPQQAMPLLPWLPSKEYPSDHIEIGVEYELL
jgi:hypothetical protein